MPKIIAIAYFILIAFILFNLPSLEATRMLPDPPEVLQAHANYNQGLGN